MQFFRRQRLYSCLYRSSLGKISYFYKTNDLNLLAFVLEKDKPSFNKKTNNYKDGIHIIYPYLPVFYKMRKHLIGEIAKIAENNDIFKNIKHINSYDNMFDTAIVRTPWLLYGSRKASGSLYKLTHIFNKNFISLDKSVYNNKKLIQVLSNRKFIGKKE